MPERDWLTTAEAAERLQVHPVTVRRWRVEDEPLQYVRIGSTCLYHVDALDKYLEANYERIRRCANRISRTLEENISVSQENE